MVDKETVRQQQLNLVAEMAASIGHEVRNPMTSVRGFLQLLMGKKEYAGDRDFFELMIDELDRANSIITEFLSLARDKEDTRQRQNLNHVLRSVYPLLQAEAVVSDKRVEMDLAPVPDMLLEVKEIRQVIYNLVRNGLEAMEPGGRLTVKTYADDREAVLAVADQGGGIDPAVMAKVGTPFFTTKEGGTGLGLAVCHSIAARHNAKIDVASGASGTTFSVRFKLPQPGPGDDRVIDGIS